MSKSGHPLTFLEPNFPVELRRKLEQKLSIQTAEELLGLAATQDLLSFARDLSVTAQVLQDGIQVAKAAVGPRFLREIGRPIVRYATGAEIDEPFDLPEELARYLQNG